MASGAQRTVADTGNLMAGRGPAGRGTSSTTQADSAAEAGEGRQQLRALIQLGRERGYLTHRRYQRPSGREFRGHRCDGKHCQHLR